MMQKNERQQIAKKIWIKISLSLSILKFSHEVDFFFLFQGFRVAFVVVQEIFAINK